MANIHDNTDADMSIQLFAEAFFVPLYLLACKLYKPLLVGTAMLPLLLSVVPVSGIVGALIAASGSYRWAVWTGLVLNTIGTALLGTLTVDTPTPVWVVIFVCAGAGQGMLLIGYSVTIQASVEEDDVAHAVSMYSFLRSLGFVFGYLLGAVIVENLLNARLLQLELVTDFARGGEALVTNIPHVSDTSIQLRLREAFAWALRRLFVFMASLSGFGLLCSAWIRPKSLKR